MIRIHARRAFAAATIAFLSLSTAAFAASNPIPGVDIIVRKHPGPSPAITVKTDKNGRFSVSGLAPGEYELTWSVPPSHRAAISTTRSNIKHPNIAVTTQTSNGTQQVTIEIQVGTDSLGRLTSGTTADSHQNIVITGKRGGISGMLSRWTK